MRLRYRYPDGSEYAGEWNDQGQRRGLGQLILPDGTRYMGHFMEGLCHGPGVMVFADGSKYEGELTKGKFDGVGVYLRADGMKYEGEFKEGQIYGKGIVTFSDGTHGLPRNEGYFEQSRLLRQEKCTLFIDKAVAAAQRARNQIQDIEVMLSTIKS